MSYLFTKDDIEKISAALQTEISTRTDESVRFVIQDPKQKRNLELEIIFKLELGEKTGNLVSLYTPLGLMQLHSCTNYIASQELGEVIMFAESKDTVSGLIISKDAGVTTYTNVHKSLLSKDPFKLRGEVLGCAIQLSLTEHKLEEMK
jgi:hypothetical protein